MEIITINFINNYHDIVFVSVNNGGFVDIQPNSKLTVTCAERSEMQIVVKLCGDSHLPKKSKSYVLKLESSYLFCNVFDGEIFIINREKIRISSNAYYDRLFVNSANAIVKSHKNAVMQENEIKTHYRKCRLVDTFLIGPFFEQMILSFELVVLGIVLTIIGGWKIAIIYFPLLYIVLFLWNAISDMIENSISKTSDFNAFFDSEFIDNYYNNPQREAYMGDIEVN